MSGRKTRQALASLRDFVQTVGTARAITDWNPIIDVSKVCVKDGKLFLRREVAADWLAAAEAAEAQRFTNLLGDFDLDQPRVYNGVWL